MEPKGTRLPDDLDFERDKLGFLRDVWMMEARNQSHTAALVPRFRDGRGSIAQ
jgi:hypothetical protein